MSLLGFDPGDLHPLVQKRFWGIKYLNLGLMVLFLLMALIPLAVFYDEFKGNLSYYLLYVCLPLFAAFWIVVFVNRWYLAPRLVRMSRTIVDNEPRPMLMKCLGSDLRGRERVELYPPDHQELQDPWCVVEIKTLREGAFPKKTLPVKVFQDQTQADAFIVIDTGSEMVWGNVVLRRH